MTTITRRRAEHLLRALAVALLAAGPARAFDLTLPGSARLAEEKITDPGSYSVPIAPWTEMEGLLTRAVEGRIQRQAWRIEASGLTVLQIMEPLRAQLEEAGWEILLDCAARDCGGFDFRFATEVIRGPAMYVDLTSYRYLSARSPDGEYMTLMVSRSPAAGFLQVIRASEETVRAPGTTDAPGESVVAVPTPDLIQTLEAQGHAVLDDLTFASGADELEPGDIASLEALADYLRGDPARRVLFVGHTDATGSAAANVEISRNRARAARGYLQAKGIPAPQMEADGAGYLAPIASNLTDAGREENRRVEVVLLPAVE